VFLIAAVQLMEYVVRSVSSSPTATHQQGSWFFGNFVTAIQFPLYKNHPDQWNVGTLYGVFVWSTLMGVFWLGIFSASIIIANVSIKLRGVGSWIDKWFDVQNQPLKILAALTIAFVVTVCLIYHMFVWIWEAV
jgi:hypothetical protein